MVREGSVPFREYRTWYEVHGDLGVAPALLVLHGGPGLPHDYLIDLAALSESGRPIVFYDQLGCGRSDRPDDDRLWTLDTFVDELAAVRRHLGLDRLHLLGHSWGGWLALEYVLRRGSQAGLVSLTLASTCPSLPRFAIVTAALKALLPAGVPETLDRHEAARTTDHEDYQAAVFEYMSRYLYRHQPLPDHMMAAFAARNDRAYALMQGSEWNVTGTLKDWDVTDRLREIEVPTLVTSGRYDEMTPAIVDPLAAGIPGAEWVMFEESAHFAMSEEPDRYRSILSAFLKSAEEGVALPAALPG